MMGCLYSPVTQNEAVTYLRFIRDKKVRAGVTGMGKTTPGQITVSENI